MLILLRAFSSGAIALSGVEAISNGVPAFRKPESKNAATTLTIMGAILGIYFFGIAVLAHHLAPVPSENETLLSVMGRAVFGSGTPMYLILQVSTFAILVLAANTAYADFPRLSSIIARDGYLPRQLANRGDRLVFSNGILVLSGAAAVLIVAFGGQTSLLIQLYAVGVFTGFTLSQAGMVVHHWRLREPHWKVGLAINATGAVATAIVMLIVVVSKFTKGAWIPAVLIPLIVLFFKSIKNHYTRVEEALDVSARLPHAPSHAHHRRARRAGAPRHAGRHRVRAVARTRPARGHVGRHRPGRGAKRSSSSGRTTTSTSRWRSSCRRTATSPARSSSSSTSSTGPTRTTSSP